MISDESIKVIEACLDEAFPGFSIEGKPTKEGGYLFRISHESDLHLLYVDTDADRGKDSEALRQYFYDCNVASVLRQIGDFTVSLTDSGCIFGNP